MVKLYLMTLAPTAIYWFPGGVKTLTIYKKEKEKKYLHVSISGVTTIIIWLSFPLIIFLNW